MKHGDLVNILRVVFASNPNNYYINNPGLAALGETLFYPKKGKKKLQQQLLKTLRQGFPDTFQDILDSLKRYHLTSYYTPREIIQYKIGLLKKNGFEPRTILEPSAGNGAYVQELKLAFPKAKITALEPDILTFAILEANNLKNENVSVHRSTFEDFFLEHRNKSTFDLIITNIPFGDIPISKGYRHDYLTDAKLGNVGNYFNVFAPQLCTNGGITMLLTSSAFAEGTAYNHFREAILQENELILANRFNNKLFEKEGTQVVSDLLIYKRVRHKKELSPIERQFISTEQVTLDGQTFLTNAYFKNTPEAVHGDPKMGFFHNRPGLTIVPDEIPLTHFLERQTDGFSFRFELQQHTEQVGLPDGGLEKARIKDTVENTAIIVDDNSQGNPKTEPQIQRGTTAQAISLHDEYCNSHTRLFFGSYNFNKEGNIRFFTDPQTSRNVPQKLRELVSDYVRLRNNLVLLELNIDQGRLDTTEITKRFNDIDYGLDTFHFKWGNLVQHHIFLKEDHFYEYARKTFESKEDGKLYGKKPAFTLQKFLNAKELVSSKAIALLAQQGEPTAKEAPNTNDATQFTTPEEMARHQFDTMGQIDIREMATAFKMEEKELLQKGLVEKAFFLEPDPDAALGFKVVPYFLFASGYISEKLEYAKRHTMPFGLHREMMVNALEELLPTKLDLDDIEFNFESHFIPKSAKEAFLRHLINENVAINISQFSSTLTLIFAREHNQEAHERFSVVLNHSVKARYKRILQNFAENRYPVIFTSYKDKSGKSIRRLDKDATLMAQNLYEELQLHFKSYIESRQELKSTIEENYYNAFLADVNITVPRDWLTFPKTLVYPPYQHQIDSALFGLVNGSALNDHKVGKGKTLSMALLAHKLKQHGKSKRTLLLTLKSVAPQLEKEIRANFPKMNIVRLSSKTMAKSKRAATLAALKKHRAIDLIIAEHGHLKQIPKDRDYVIGTLEEKLDMIEQDLETAKEYGGMRESKKLIKGLVKRQANLENKLQQTLKKLDERTHQAETTLSDLNIEALMIDEAHYFKNIGYTTRHQNVSGLNNNADNQQNLDLEISIKSIHSRVGEDQNVFFYTGTPLKNSVTELYAYQRYLTPHELKRRKIFNFDAWASIFLKQSVSIEPNIFGEPRMHARFRYYTNLPELSKMYNSFAHICRDKHFKTHDLEVDRDFVILDSNPAYEQLKQASLEFTRNKNQLALFNKPIYTEDQMTSAHITALNINRSLLIDPLSKDDLAIGFTEADQYKLRRLCKDISELYEKTNEHKGVCLVFGDLNVWKPDKYNSYDRIKEILVEEYNIPAYEIAMAQQEKNKNRTHVMQEGIRQGDIRIALGSTQVLGTGTNIQDRVVGIFHMDIPYSPDAFDQRAGRGVRKGNVVAPLYGNKVVERFYGIKDTTDIFSYSLNTHKEKFREQIRETDPTKRIYDDLIPDDKSLSYEQMQAALIGDMDQFQLVKLSDDLKFLQSQKRLHEINKSNSVTIIERIEKQNSHILVQLRELEKAQKNVGHLDIPVDEAEKGYMERQQHALQAIAEDSKLAAYIPDLVDAKVYIGRLSSAIVSRSNLNLHAFKKVTVAHLPKLGASLIFEAEYVPASQHHLFAYGFEFRNTTILGRKQRHFDLDKVAFQLTKLYTRLEKRIKTKKFDAAYNLRSMETHKKKTALGFPKEKTAKMQTLKEEIREIKKRRAIKLG